MLLHASPSAPKTLRQARALVYLLLLASSILWLFKRPLSDFDVPAPLSVHTALETINIIIFTSVFIVGWNAFGEARKKSSLILAVSFLCSAVLGFLHAITFKGMPGFFSALDMHRSLSFWLLSRWFVATTLLGLSFNPRDSAVTPGQAYAVFFAGLAATAGWAYMVLFFPDFIPRTYEEGAGQSTFKLSCEVILFSFHVFTASQFYRQARRYEAQFGNEQLRIDRAPLFVASASMAISGVYFYFYVDATEPFVVIGHAIQLIASIAIYKSMVGVNIHAPYASLAATSEALARSAKELDLQRARLGRLIDTAMDGIITIDTAQRIVLANPAAASMFGYPVQALIDLPLAQVIPERHRDIHHQHVLRFAETGESRRRMGNDQDDLTLYALHASGEEFPIEASISSQFEGTERFFTVIFRDVTERHSARLKMLAYQAELSELSAVLQSIREEERKHIARELHDDLGQLLAALRMDLSLLQRDTPQEGRTSQRLASMDQLLLSAITTLRRIATDLRPRALDEGGLYYALHTLQKEFSTRHCVNCSIDASEEQLILDDARSTAIFRIIQESLTNVARHAHAQEVRIHFSRDEESIRFSIEDDGKGLAAEDTRKTRSFGLVGMRERVKAMHGEFQINGTPGQGTRLDICLPLTH